MMGNTSTFRSETSDSESVALNAVTLGSEEQLCFEYLKEAVAVRKEIHKASNPESARFPLLPMDEVQAVDGSLPMKSQQKFQAPAELRIRPA